MSDEEKERLLNNLTSKLEFLNDFISQKNWQEANYMARDIATITDQLFWLDREGKLQSS